MGFIQDSQDYVAVLFLILLLLIKRISLVHMWQKRVAPSPSFGSARRHSQTRGSKLQRPFVSPG